MYGSRPNVHALIGHDGGQTGANTQLIIYPRKKVVVVVLANTSGTGNDVGKFAVKLLEACIQMVN